MTERSGNVRAKRENTIAATVSRKDRGRSASLTKRRNKMLVHIMLRLVVLVVLGISFDAVELK